MKLRTFKRAELLIDEIDDIKLKLEKIKNFHKNELLDEKFKNICEIAYESLYTLKILKEKEFENL